MSSSEMFDEPETPNPFEKLSDDPIPKICSFLRGTDLLKLSEVDKKFKRIITESTETMSKIPLVLSFEGDIDLNLDFAIELAHARKFTALRINHRELTDADANIKFLTLLELLSGSVDDLTVKGNVTRPRELLSTVITINAGFLPKLKKCKLESVTIDPEVFPIVQEISPRSNVNHALESLELVKTRNLEVLRLFSGCNQLKEFCYSESKFDASAEDIDQVNNFLATQDRLKKLTFNYEGLAWDRLRCFKLRELTAECLPYEDDELAAATFLQKLPDLVKLDITCDHPSRPIIREICQAPKLEKLSIKCWFNGPNENSLDMLVNHTVKELHIHDFTGITRKLLKIFLGIDTVCLGMDTIGFNEEVLDLSDVPPEVVMKIKCHEYCRSFSVIYSPSDIPADVEQFQSDVMKFTKECSTFILSIKIGHENWLNNGAFRLSNSFCENLVNQLPKLVKLEGFNIADRGRFIAFLDENEARLTLEDVVLHKPFEAGEPKPKKMKIQAN